MPINYWTPEEDKLLKELYSTSMPVNEIAKRLVRSKNAVNHRAHVVGAKRYNRRVYRGCNEDCFNCSYPDCMKQTGFYKSY